MDEKIVAILKLIGFQHAEDPSRIKEDLIRQAGESKEAIAVALVSKLDISKVNDAIKAAVEMMFTQDELTEAVKLAETPVAKKARMASASINKAVADAIAKEATKLMSSLDSSSPFSELFKKATVPVGGGVKKEPPSGLKVGDEVILKKHRSKAGEDDNWRPAMDKFVGKKTSIKRIVGFDPQGYEVATVSTDDERHMWRTRDMDRPS